MPRPPIAAWSRPSVGPGSRASRENDGRVEPTRRAASAVSSPKLWPAGQVGRDAEMCRAGRAHPRLNAPIAGCASRWPAAPASCRAQFLVGKRGKRINRSLKRGRLSSSASAAASDSCKLRENGTPVRGACRRIATLALGRASPAFQARPPLPGKSRPAALRGGLAVDGRACFRDEPSRSVSRSTTSRQPMQASASMEPRPRLSGGRNARPSSRAAREGVKRGGEGVTARGRERDELHLAVPIDRRLRGLRLFQDTMKIAAAEAECRHRRAVADGRNVAAKGVLRVHIKRRLPWTDALDRLGRP